MGLKIGIVSGKGGVGKSIVTANIAVTLSKRGYKIVIVDADVEMAALHNYLGTTPGRYSIKDVIEGNAYIDQALIEGPEDVVVLPSKLSLYDIARIGVPEVLEAISPLSALADIMLIDGPAGLKQMPVAMLELCDLILIVTTPEISAIQGGMKLRLAAKAFDTDVLGVIINRTTPDIGDAIIKKMEDVFQAQILGTVPEDKIASQSLRKSKPIVLSNQYSDFSKAVVKITNKILLKCDMAGGEEVKAEFMESYEKRYGRKEEGASSGFFGTLQNRLKKE